MSMEDVGLGDESVTGLLGKSATAAAVARPVSRFKGFFFF